MTKDEAGRWRSPSLTVDGVVLLCGFSEDGSREHQILLVRRAHDPFAGHWAFPGGFVDYGEDPDAAIMREITEETGLDALPFRQFRAYGSPARDPRGHTVSIVYTAELVGNAPEVVGGDDADLAEWFPLVQLPPLAFDHETILKDVRRSLRI